MVPPLPRFAAFALILLVSAKVMVSPFKLILPPLPVAALLLATIAPELVISPATISMLPPLLTMLVVLIRPELRTTEPIN